MARSYSPAQAYSIVQLIYRQVLERDLDGSGAITWGSALTNGQMSVRDVVRAVGHSQEYFNRFVSLGARQAAVLMYRHFLGRAPDSEFNLDQHAQEITQDWQKGVDGFVYSPEYTQHFGDDVVPHPWP